MNTNNMMNNNKSNNYSLSFIEEKYKGGVFER